MKTALYNFFMLRYQKFKLLKEYCTIQKFNSAFLCYKKC